MANRPLLFQSEIIANALIAGVHSAARAVYQLRQSGRINAGEAQDLIAIGGWTSPGMLQRELTRLCPDIHVRFVPLPTREQDQAALAIDGLAAIGGSAQAGAERICDLLERSHLRDNAAAYETIAAASRTIIAGTGKPTDGLVSRWINRPISQFLSAHLLKLNWIRPIHATIAAGLIAAIMAIFLFFGGREGLILGAILFQSASIIDGVDGEIARATFRSSKSGATLDTAMDALTNFAFIAGVNANIWQDGHAFAGKAGLVALAVLLVGLGILGLLSIRAGGPLSFDALKNDTRTASSPIMAFLAKVASRDVYALVLAVLIIAGFAAFAMVFFATATAIWFVTALAMLTRKSAKP